MATLKPVVIDISHHNKVLSFPAIAASGIRGVIHKATQGAGYTDPDYAARRAAAREAGLLWGAYHFANNAKVPDQVAHFLSVAQPDADTLLALDWETEPNGRTMWVGQAREFLTLLMERTGRAPNGIWLYGGNVLKEQIVTQDDVAFFAQFSLWLCHYGVKKPVLPKGWAKQGYGLWQYSESGHVDGMAKDGKVDLNVFGGKDLTAEWVGAGAGEVPVAMAEPPAAVPPLLEEMRRRLGVQEVRGSGVNPEIIAYFGDVGHGEIVDDDTTAWCAACVGSALRRKGYPVPPRDVNLLARAYCTYGVACEPQPGAIGVIPRGASSWMGHVFVIEKVRPDGVLETIGGNQGAEGYGQVSRALVDPRRTKLLACRLPVEASVAALREAGSTEVANADMLQKAGIAASAGSAVAAVAKDLVTHSTPETVSSLPETLTFMQQIIEGANAVAKLLLENPWFVGIILVSLAAWWLGRRWKAQRLAKHEAGAPLSNEVMAG